MLSEMPILVWACRVSRRVWFGQPFTISSTQQVNKKNVYLVMMCWQVSSGGQATLCLASAAGSIFQPLLLVIDKKRTCRVFKYRLFQSQRVILGQRGAQDITLAMRAYAGDHTVAKISGLGRDPELQVEISFMAQWKRVYTLTKPVLCGPGRHKYTTVKRVQTKSSRAENDSW